MKALIESLERLFEVDFNTTMKIIKVISTHNDYIFNVLDKERPEGIAVADSYSSATRKAIISALPGYFTTEDMKKVAANVGKSLRTLSFAAFCTKKS